MAKWFENTTWSDEIEQEFFRRLRRSPTDYHKAQKVAIQAHKLSEARDHASLEAAIQLTEYLLETFPSEQFFHASVLNTRGDALRRLGRAADALDAYLAGVEAERVYPNVKTHAPLNFAEIVVELERADHYDTVLRILESREPFEDAFPASRYASARAQAVIHFRRRNLAAAARSAEEALLAAQKTESPFRYHRSLGLANPSSSEIEQLQEIIASATPPN